MLMFLYIDSYTDNNLTLTTLPATTPMLDFTTLAEPFVPYQHERARNYLPRSLLIAFCPKSVSPIMRQVLY